MTWSPTLHCVTPSPILSTIPPPSCPKITWKPLRCVKRPGVVCMADTTSNNFYSVLSFWRRHVNVNNFNSPFSFKLYRCFAGNCLSSVVKVAMFVFLVQRVIRLVNSTSTFVSILWLWLSDLLTSASSCRLVAT